MSRYCFQCSVSKGKNQSNQKGIAHKRPPIPYCHQRFRSSRLKIADNGNPNITADKIENMYPAKVYIINMLKKEFEETASDIKHMKNVLINAPNRGARNIACFGVKFCSLTLS